MSNVKMMAGYGTVIAETPEEAHALYEFITNYRAPKADPEPASIPDMLHAVMDMMYDDPDIDYTDDIIALTKMIERVEGKIIDEFACPDCGEMDCVCEDEEDDLDDLLLDLLNVMVRGTGIKIDF